MIGSFELGYLLHVFEAEDEDSVFGSYVEVTAVYFYFYYFREEGDAAGRLVTFGIVACQFSLARVALVFLHLEY